MSNFADNPIIVTMTVGSTAFPTDSTNRRIVLTVTVDGHDYKFYHSAENGESYSIDISGAYRSGLRRKGESTPSSPSSPTVSGSCSAILECIMDGILTTIGQGVTVTGGSTTARNGGFSESQIYNGVPEVPAILSTKPTNIAEVVGVGEVIMCGGTNATATAGSQSFNGHTVYGEETNYRHTMYFLNQYGEVETASLVSLEALSVSYESETVSQVRSPRAESYEKKRVYKTGDYNKWKMSSGFLEREWLQWFAHDFVKSKHHWIKTDQGIIPCEVTVSDVDIYDRASGELKAVNFTVVSGLEGEIFL